MEYKAWMVSSAGAQSSSMQASQSSRIIEMILAAIAALISMVSYWHYLSTNAILAYGDSMSHLMISKRILSSPTPGVGQSGGLWPPLVHWLALPFIKNDWMYRTGTAESIISMVSYVVTAVFVYKITQALLPEFVHWPAIIAAVIFMTNRDALYMQSTPMSELPLLACVTVSVYYFIKWCQSDRIQYLALCMVAVLMATGIRYEGWALLLAFLVAIVYIAFRQRWSWLRLRDMLVYFGVFASLFIAFWVFWNWTILGDPLGWIRGEYSSPSNWVSDTDRTVGDPVRAAHVYWLAMQRINGLEVIIIGLVGLGLFMLSHKLKPQTCGLYVLTFPFAFYTPLLAAGQRPLHVPELDGDLYNVRFALQTVPFFAIMAAFAAYMGLRWFGRGRAFEACTILVSLGLCFLSQPTVASTLVEPEAARKSEQANVQMEAAACLGEVHRDHEMVLMETYGNERLLFDSGISLDWVIYEGSNKGNLWQSALNNPSHYASWLVMRYTAQDTDKVWRTVYQQHPEQLKDYTLIFANREIAVYMLSALGDRRGASCTITPLALNGWLPH